MSPIGNRMKTVLGENAMSDTRTLFSRLTVLLITSLAVAGCVLPNRSEPPPQPAAPVAPVVAAPSFGPVVLESGQCSEAVSLDLASLRARQTDESLQGLSECELVALKGVPLSVQTGSSPNARRETTMLYMEATGKAVYLFADNKLTRVIRAGQ